MTGRGASASPAPKALDPATSLFMDLLRFAAAFGVFLCHFSSPVFSAGRLPWLWGHGLVIIFFVLSGYVIAYVSDQKENNSVDYSINRLARLYSVVVPSLVLTFSLDTLGSHWDLSVYADRSHDQEFIRLASALTFTSEIWFLNITPLSNYAFWSLPYEFWFYVIFGLIKFVSGRARVLGLIAVCCFIGPKMLVYLPIWWLGVVIYRAGPLLLRPVTARLLLLACVGLFFVVYGLDNDTRMTVRYLPLGFSPYDFLLAILAGLAIAIVKACALDFRPFARPIRYLASNTLTLYLCHLPLLSFFSAALPAMPIVERIAVLFVATLVTVDALARITEHRKHAVRRMMLFAIERASVLWGWPARSSASVGPSVLRDRPRHLSGH